MELKVIAVFLYNLGQAECSYKERGKKGHSAIDKVVTQEYTIDIHKHTHDVGFKKYALQALKEIHKFVMKEMGTPDVHIDTRLHQLSGPKECLILRLCTVVQKM
ncbi:60S ribosomal protein L31 [Tupaia chinensis]|uniref:60S ribosomal protein L31 n=1 Tax=Tupaia chinensis TaxID=246437 RepID=L9LG50_TUPCH|nr:60S ribosomal protein L31 [Tupaia chinensis]